MCTTCICTSHDTNTCILINISLSGILPHCSCQVISNHQFYVYSTGSDVPDHVPVDDNPAYTSMATLHSNNNSAYETVTQLPSVN